MRIRINARHVLLAVALLATAASMIWLWRASSSEPMAAFRTFPHAYICESAAGYDETAVVIHRGTIAGPPSVEVEGGIEPAWPAYVDASGLVVPSKEGRPYIIPLIAQGNDVRTPVIRPLGRPLRGAEIANLVRYLTPEGAERMAAFRKEMLP